MTVPKPKDSRSWRDTYYHRLFGLMAAKEVERVLPIFEKECPDDDRPRRAMQAVMAWAQGQRELGMAEVRELSLAAHAAAREAKTDGAKFAARAAGQAVASWHVPTHALGAFSYAARARVAGTGRKLRAN